MEKEEKEIHDKVDYDLPESPAVTVESQGVFKFVDMSIFIVDHSISKAELLAEMEKRGLRLPTKQEVSAFIETRLAEVRRFGTEARDTWDEYCCLCVFRE